MKLKPLLCLIALTTPMVANADFLSVSVGGGTWSETPTGNIQKTNDPANVDLERDFFWEKESQGYFFASFEHFVPLVPNVKIVGTKMDHAGSGNVTIPFIFDGNTFTGNVSNTFSIETKDLVAYYEVLDNIVSLDIGLNIRDLSIDYTISSASVTVTDSVSKTVPMLYAMVGASPLPDLIFSAEMSYIGFSGSNMTDVIAKVAYTTSFFLGIEAGYRSHSYKLDDVSSTDAKLDFSGPFVGAYLKF